MQLLSYVDYVSLSDSVSVIIPELTPESEEEEVVYEDLEIATSHRKRRRPSAARSEVMRLRREAMRKRKAEMETAWKKLGETAT